MDLPLDFIKRMKEMLGSEYDRFSEAFCDDKNNTAIRINTMKDKSSAVEKKFSLTDKVQWCSSGFYVDKSEISGNHPYHAAGLIYFQEPSAMAPVEAIPIEKGDYILDLCAAPGGKTTQAAAKLDGTGLIVSNEIVEKRSKILAENVARLGFKNVVVTNESPGKLEEKYEGFFDKVIVDAPCSGEGMFRKEKQAMECWSIEHTKSCGIRQRAIIDSAIKCLRKGGYLVYSTCTFAIEENENIARYILEKYPYMKIENPEELSMLSNGIGISEAKRIYPHKQKGEGHFVALFHDTREAEERWYNVKSKSCRVQEYEEFEKEFLNTHLEGKIIEFGDNIYLLPYGIDIDKIKTVLPGLHLGVRKKNRFEPSYNLCHALASGEIRNTVDFPADSEDLMKYLTGECIECNKKGWTAVCVDGFPLGWGKASGGILKNHYPKQLRLLKR